MDPTTPASTPPIAALYAALAKAQGEIRNATKGSVNPHFKSSYADLASIWDACREPLSRNGLCVIQRLDVAPSANGAPGRLFLETTLGHASGAEIQSNLPLDAKPGDNQGLGSALTYLRRYALAALVGVAPEDDDGEGAQAQQRPARPPPAPKRQAPEPEAAPDAQPEIDKWKASLDACLTLGELDDLKAALRVAHPKPGDGAAEHPVVRVLAPAIKAKGEALKKVKADAVKAGEASAAA